MAIDGQAAEAIFAGVAVLVKLLNRHITRSNDVLKQRKELAAELRASCSTWADMLMKMINEVVEQWEQGDKIGAERTVMKLVDEFQSLDYGSLDRDRSTTLRFLTEDDRFADFAIKCAGFYTSALKLKRLCYGEIRGRYASEAGLPTMAQLWREEVRTMLDGVNAGYNALKTIEPS